jgi:predicted nucleic acid-binding protein
MTAPVFVDTNVLVYSRDSRDAAKQQRAHDWLDFLWESKRGRLSRQVLQEYYVTVTQKLKPGMAVEEARADVRALYHWLAPIEAEALLESAWTLQDRFSLSFWDALVVGAAECAGCTHLVSEDLQSAQGLGGIRVVNPFETHPSELRG